MATIKRWDVDIKVFAPDGEVLSHGGYNLPSEPRSTREATQEELEQVVAARLRSQGESVGRNARGELVWMDARIASSALPVASERLPPAIGATAGQFSVTVEPDETIDMLRRVSGGVPFGASFGRSLTDEEAARVSASLLEVPRPVTDAEVAAQVAAAMKGDAK